MSSENPYQENPYQEIVARLDAIVEELADRGMADLAQSIAEDGNTYGDQQKLLGKARRSVEKAAHLLRGEQTPW